MANLIGYVVSMQDNGTYMYDDVDALLPKCPRCGCRLDFFKTNPDYVPKKRHQALYMDEPVTQKNVLTHTYDLQLIATSALRDFCLRQGYEGMEFVPFAKYPHVFHLLLHRQVKYDVERGKPEFGPLCPVCHNYEFTVAPDYFFEVDTPLADGFYRSDMLFGGNNTKAPLKLIGIETKAKLKEAKLKGLTFEPAYGMN